MVRVLLYPILGPHDALDQFRAVLEHQPLFNNDVAIVVDDFQCADVQVLS